MKKYKFLVKRTKEIEIQISAESHSEALFKMLQKVVKKDENFFTEDLENRKELFIYIEKIIDENGKENVKDKENFIKENSFFISKIDRETYEKGNEEIEDDLPKEDVGVVCDKCKNYIPIDEIIHQLES